MPSRPTCRACTCSAGRAGEGHARPQVTGHRRAPCRPGGLSAAPSLPPAQPLTLCGLRCACPHQRGRVRGWNRCAAESLRTGRQRLPWLSCLLGQRSGFRGVAKRRGLASGRNGQASLLRVQGVNVRVLVPLPPSHFQMPGPNPRAREAEFQSTSAQTLFGRRDRIW